MTKLDFHHFHVRHFNNVFEQSWCHCRVGATPASRSNCLQTCRIHHQVKYRRKNANTCIEAAILFSGHPYIGRHYRATLIVWYSAHIISFQLFSVVPVCFRPPLTGCLLLFFPPCCCILMASSYVDISV